MNKNLSTGILTLVVITACFFCTHTTLAQKKFDGIVEEDGKYGVEISKNHRRIQVIKPKFDDIVLGKANIRPEVYFYKKKGKWGILHVDDYKEKAFIDTQAEFDSIAYYPSENYFKANYFIVWKDKKLAIIGIVTYNEAHRQISEFWDDIIIDNKSKSLGQTLVVVREGNSYGLMHLNGKIVLAPEYSSYENVNYIQFRKYFYYIFRKTDGCVAVMDPKDSEKEPMILTGDKMWVDKYVFSAKGSDTTVFYANAFLKMPEFLKQHAALKERDKGIANMERENKLKEIGKNQIESNVRSIVAGNYLKTEKINLASGKSVYLLVDSSGVKCLNTETAEFDYSKLKLISYWKADGQVFVKKENDTWLRYPSEKEYVTLTPIRSYMSAIDADDNCTVFYGTSSRTFKVDKYSEVTDYVEDDNSYLYVYRRNGRSGFASYSKSGMLSKFLPAVFDNIHIIHTYNNNPRIKLVYNGEELNAYHDDIKISNGNASVIKCDLYGNACGNSNCKNGIIGYSNKTIEGKTTVKQFNNTTVWRRGHLELANVTVTETTPDKTVREAEYCKDAIHSVKNVWLLYDPVAMKYYTEKK